MNLDKYDEMMESDRDYEYEDYCSHLPGPKTKEEQEAEMWETIRKEREQMRWAGIKK